MSRDEVYEAIDSERNFVESLKADLSRPDIREDLHVGDTLAAIKYNLDKAVTAWYLGSDPHIEAMNYMRKIAALCVQAGEEYGMLSRRFDQQGRLIHE